jgi:glycosyltransferase involved in cell wall biosynthesis
LSYGIVARNIIKELNNLTQVCLNPIQIDNDLYQEFFPFIKNYYTDFNMHAPSLRIYHENLLMDHMGKGMRVAFPFFERNVFDQIRRFNVKNQDLIISASKWGEEVLKKNGATDVEVVNIGVDPIFRPDPQVFKRKDRIVFLNIGKQEKRKGHDVLGEYFAQATQGYDDAELWIMWDNPFLTRDERKFEYRRNLGDKVKFINRLSLRDLVHTINQADIGIFLSRAEGWNMPLLECMACGKDIIATDYSAHTEFLPDADGVFKISPVKMEVAEDNIWFFGDFTWMDIKASKEQIIESIRSAYKRQKEKREINTYVAEHARKFTWENTAKGILTAIQQRSS